jgi:hypothetical protein
MSISGRPRGKSGNRRDCVHEGHAIGQLGARGHSGLRALGCVGLVRLGKEDTTMSKQQKTKAQALAAVQALIAGTQKHFPNGSFTLGNTPYTTASLVQLLQSLADAMTAVNTAQVAAKHALTTEQGALAQVDPVIQIYERYLQATFANTLPILDDFGLAPPKVPGPKTTEVKAAAAAKGKATREARGTTGKKEKLAV